MESGRKSSQVEKGRSTSDWAKLLMLHQHIKKITFCWSVCVQYVLSTSRHHRGCWQSTQSSQKKTNWQVKMFSFLQIGTFYLKKENRDLTMRNYIWRQKSANIRLKRLLWIDDTRNPSFLLWPVGALSVSGTFSAQVLNFQTTISPFSDLRYHPAGSHCPLHYHSWAARQSETCSYISLRGNLLTGTLVDWRWGFFFLWTYLQADILGSADQRLRMLLFCLPPKWDHCWVRGQPCGFVFGKNWWGQNTVWHAEVEEKDKYPSAGWIFKYEAVHKPQYDNGSEGLLVWDL